MVKKTRNDNGCTIKLGNYDLLGLINYLGGNELMSLFNCMQIGLLDELNTLDNDMLFLLLYMCI